MIRPAVHFVWFRGDEYLRALRDIAPGDTVVFARGGHGRAQLCHLPGVRLPE